MNEAMNYGLCLDSGEFIAADELNSQAEQANRLFDERDARIAELERELAEVRKQMDAQKDEWLSWEAKRSALEKDAERLNFIESMGYGIGWIARNSTTGRGYRLHNDKDGTHITARGAIDAAMKGQK